MKRIHLICNAHIDPVWQWEWEEGAAEAISTFRVAADLCDTFGDYIFCHNESILYRWVEEYEPELFERIVKLVNEGRWHIMGGWHLQPDCNMPSGEGFVRQIAEGRKYFGEKFNKYPKTAINVDPFGHTRGLVQIMAKSGYDNYIFMRPFEVDCHVPRGPFRWVGYDGSEVVAERSFSWYCTHLGEAVPRIKEQIEDLKDDETVYCLWGVGNHGGGPSFRDLTEITEFKKQLEAEGAQVELIHSTPDDYFGELKNRDLLPEHTGDINPWAVGCYTSQVRIKQRYRRTENELFMTEKMCSAAELAGVMKYPAEELENAQREMLTIQFHDSLPGSSIQDVEEMALRILDHSLEMISKVKARAFFALCKGQRKAASDEIPVLVYNPNPFEIEETFEGEFMLWGQNRTSTYYYPKVFRDGVEIASQPEKERSNHALDWRKRVVFTAKIPPMQVARFDCKFDILESKPVPTMPSDETHFLFDNGTLSVKINKATGLIDSYKKNGMEYVKENAFSLDVMQDDEDPWGMRFNSRTEKIGQFELLSLEESTKFTNVREPLAAVRVVEDGKVRTVVEAVFGYGSSKAVVQYKLNKVTSDMDMKVRVQWAEKAKMLKLNIPTTLGKCDYYGQQAYGVEKLPTTQRECVAQKYVYLDNGNNVLALINDGIYGSSATEDTIKMTLLRSPAYCAHPDGDKEFVPQNRYTAYIEQGERLYDFRVLAGGSAEINNKLPRAAATFNEKPMTLSFFPSGLGELPKVKITVDAPECVECNAIKKANDGNGHIIRVFNASAEAQKVTVKLDDGYEFAYDLGKYEIATFRLSDGKITLCDLMENIL
ncbi:MAG: alpha-mannosidase [Ruminococcaceae bacterium]|nr:alpha-mannosidase [Oscillospiraceae bacterium]